MAEPGWVQDPLLPVLDPARPVPETRELPPSVWRRTEVVHLPEPDVLRARLAEVGRA